MASLGVSGTSDQAKDAVFSIADPQSRSSLSMIQ